MNGIFCVMLLKKKCQRKTLATPASNQNAKPPSNKFFSTFINVEKVFSISENIRNKKYVIKKIAIIPIVFDNFNASSLIPDYK